MRTLTSLTTVALLAGMAGAQSAPYEDNTYRYGATYRIVATGSAASCIALCAQDQVCQAWSFQRATQSLGGALCELKATIGPAVNNPLMTSGISPRLANARHGARSSHPIQTSPSLLGGPTASLHSGSVKGSVTGAHSGSVIRSVPVTSQIPIAPARTLVRHPTASSLTPPPAPVSSTTPPVRQVIKAQPAAPGAITTARARVNVPVIQGDMPPGAILLKSAPPQISFEPLSAAPLPSPPASSPPTPLTAPAVAPRQVAKATVAGETISLPKSTRQVAAAPAPLNTVPAGSVPAPEATPTKPYSALRNRKYPDFSVNKARALTPEELAEQEQAADRQILDRVNIDSVDLAEDIGEPIIQNPAQRRPLARTGGGGS